PTTSESSTGQLLTTVSSMFVAGDRVAVFSQVWTEYDERTGRQIESPYRDGYATRITLVDVSDRTNPVVERTLDVDGWMTSARLLGDDLYLVLQTYAWVPPELWEDAWEVQDKQLREYPWEGTEEEKLQWRRQARALLRPIVERHVADTPIDKLLPRQYETLPGRDIEPRSLLSCRDVYHPEGLSEPSVLTMTHLDLSGDDTDLTGTGVMANGWTVYASQDNLFVAQTSNWWWWGWGEIDATTHVHRFALDGGASTYTGSGKVDGWLWSQFAMSEYDGYLRIATTDGWTPDGPAGNNLFVLDGRLEQVGEVAGFAPGESIYAARFMGDEGYVVTFRQIDPLFTFDLSDPENPKLMGELEMPGFSSYLHPFGEDRLIGVGMDGDETGRVFGLSINLFDVSDLTSPTRIDQIVVNSDDWTWSEALWNHLAFTMHRDVLSLPVYTWEGNQGFSGMFSVAVTEDALSEVGRVGHGDLVDESQCLWTWEFEYGTCANDWWYASMRRSVVIEDNLFSISDYGIKITDLNDPSVEHARVLFYPLD
ncbi:MAG: beta-propeller domain-containing protein, partial [Myxococcota bacterium]